MSFTFMAVLSVFWGLIFLALFKVAFGFFNRKFSAWFFFPLVALVYFGIPLLQKKAEDDLFKQNTVALQQWEANQCVSPDKIRQSTFLVTNADHRGFGTGFLLEGSIIGTNRHVANAFGKEAVFVRPDGSEFSQELAHVADPRTSADLAFYRVINPMEGTVALKLATEAPRVGDQVLIVGNNHRRERFYASAATVTRGPSMSLPTFMSYIPLGITAQIMYRDRMTDAGANAAPSFSTHGDNAGGNSGSAVVNCAGEVVGVHYGGELFMLFAGDQNGVNVTLESLNAELENIPPAEDETNSRDGDDLSAT